MVNRDIILAKIAHIQESLARLKEKESVNLERFLKERDIQDIVLFNLQTAIQGCVDIASHIVSDNNWGAPGSLAALFDLLFEKKVITENTKNIMRSMVGLRNLIVHEYATLDMKLVHDLYSNRLNDFNTFLKEISTYSKL